MFLLGLSTPLFLYIPQFPARCREYIGEIYELKYYYHPPIFFFFSFSFSFFPFFFLIFHFTLYNYHDGPNLHLTLSWASHQTNRRPLGRACNDDCSFRNR
jgi:hypothetical protein